MYECVYMIAIYIYMYVYIYIYDIYFGRHFALPCTSFL